MRHVLVSALLLVSSVAAADPISDLAKRNVTKLASLAEDADLGLAKDARVVEPRGWVLDRSKTREGCVKAGAVAQALYCYALESITHTIGKTFAVTSGDLGWFHITFDARTKLAGEKPGAAITQRASGLALRSGDAWSIVAIAYADTVEDRELTHRARMVRPPEKPYLDGDTALAGTVAGWFAKGLAPHASRATSQLVASGTAPRETAAGAAAKRLAQGWDRLGLRATRIEAVSLAGGKAAWISGTVILPRKGKNKPPFALGLEAIVVPDGTDWRWVSLHFASPRPDSMDEVMDDDRLILFTPAGE